VELGGVEAPLPYGRGSVSGVFVSQVHVFVVVNRVHVFVVVNRVQVFVVVSRVHVFVVVNRVHLFVVVNQMHLPCRMRHKRSRDRKGAVLWN
jgi:hypothetical protein